MADSLNSTTAQKIPRGTNHNVIRLDAFKKSRQPPKPVTPHPTDCSFVKVIKEGRKLMGCNFWVVSPSGNYTEDCATGRKLALEYLQFIRRAALPLQWIVFDMPRQAERTGIEVGFLSAVTKAATLGAYQAGDMLSELIESY